MWVLIGTVFIASLLGSLHCVGMCGPFALLASAGPQRSGHGMSGVNSSNERKTSSGSAVISATIAYSLGRLVTYSVIGFLFGLLGMAINGGTAVAHWQQSATYVAGGLMILVGVIALARQFGYQIKLPKIASPFQSFLQNSFAKTKEMKPISRALTIGALTSLMPCGWLYTFAITAAGTGSPLWGVVLMATFWAGTVPIMAALMLGLNKIGMKLQQKIPLMMATLVILIGLFTILRRAPVLIEPELPVASNVEVLTEQVNDIDQSQLPCCQDE